jgi:hypothetical protein
MGTVGQENSGWDGFSITTNDDRYNNGFDTYPSNSSITYNPTYDPNETPEEPVFGIFDDLEKYRPFARGSIPRAQMIDMAGTLNSFPNDLIDDPSGASTFSDSNEIGETELVTDMLEEMTKDDNMLDDFVEAVNPNLIIPRAVPKQEVKPSGWLSVC